MAKVEPEVRLIHQLDPKFHKTLPRGIDSVRPKESRSVRTDNAHDLIAGFHDDIGRTHLNHKPGTRPFERVRRYYHDRHVIKKGNIPESFFEAQRRIAREQGHGDLEITQNVRNEHARVITADQKASLDLWLNYLTHEDTQDYSIGLKHWAFNGMLKLGTFDKEKGKFTKRASDTVAPFADLNHEALAYVFDYMEKKFQVDAKNLKKQERDGEFEKLIPEYDSELKTALAEANFGKLYAFAKSQLGESQVGDEVEGKWVRYYRGSDYLPLVNSLRGKGTGWCTAAESTAQKQLQGGDFYVFYSNDQNGEPTIPRVAIRMEGARIAEVRGVSENQNIDPYISSVVKAKLDEFPDAELYKKKVDDMERLTEVDKKINKGLKLSPEELKFLFELEKPIDGFGYEKDPRVKELRVKLGPEVKEDLAEILNCNIEEVAMNEADLKEGIKYFVGDIVARDMENFELPSTLKMVFGNLDLDHVDSCHLPKDLERVTGNLITYTLLDEELPPKLSFVGGDFNLYCCQATKLPDTLAHVGGSLDLHFSEIEKIPSSLKFVGGDLRLKDCKVEEIEEGLSYVGGSVKVYKSYMEGCERTTELPDSLSYVGGNLEMDLSTCTKLPSSLVSVGGNLLLPDAAKTLPPGLKSIGGSLGIRHKGIEDIPDTLEHIGGNFYIAKSNLKQFPKGLKNIGGDLTIGEESQVTDISGSLEVVGGGLSLEGSQVKKISAPLRQVGGTFKLCLWNKALQAWPPTLEHIGNVEGLGYYQNEIMDQLPATLKYFGGDVNTAEQFGRTKSYFGHLESLPDSLEHIKGSVTLGEKFKKLPDNLQRIGGNLSIWQSQVDELPPDLLYIGGHFKDAFKLTKQPDARLVVAAA